MGQPLYVRRRRSIAVSFGMVLLAQKRLRKASGKIRKTDKSDRKSI